MEKNGVSQAIFRSGAITVILAVFAVWATYQIVDHNRAAQFQSMQQKNRKLEANIAEMNDEIARIRQLGEDNKAAFDRFCQLVLDQKTIDFKHLVLCSESDSENKEP